MCRYERAPHACTALGGKESPLQSLELELQIAVSCRVVLGPKFQSSTGTFTCNIVPMGLMPPYDLRGYLPVHVFAPDNIKTDQRTDPHKSR